MDEQYVERIFVLGPPGSGKSTVAAHIAAMLGWLCVDTDAEVVRATGMRVADVFAHEGEERFRERERAALTAACDEARVVVATGGGIGERPENLALMHERGWVVSLSIAAETAWERLQAEARATGVPLGEMRPLLAGADPLARLQALMERRRAWYEQADELLVSDGLTPEEAARRIVAGVIGRGLLPPEGAVECVQPVRALGGSYEAVVAWGGVASLGARLKALGMPERLHVVADATVAALYELPLMQGLMHAGFTPALYRVPTGEGSKSREQLNAIHDWLAERRVERTEPLIALGGGVVGDLAGFAAATYLRGLPLVQVPTSLLAQVDASIGGKVAIDHPRGKNLIGAFYPPRLVLADPAALLTLPPRQRIEGWAEVVKHGVILDAEYYASLEREADALLAVRPARITEAIAGSVALKAGVVESDEREGEGGRRALLNYGHTLGHAIEAVTGYGTLLHGEAVAIGMAFAARLGQRLGVTPEDVVIRQEALLARFGLPIRAEGLSSLALLRTMYWDKKVRSGRLRWVLPTALGEGKLFADVPEAEVRATLLEIGAAGE
jgi:shikimate kinase / 3-dehydroquinate synthase